MRGRAALPAPAARAPCPRRARPRGTPSRPSNDSSTYSTRPDVADRVVAGGDHPQRVRDVLREPVGAAERVRDRPRFLPAVERRAAPAFRHSGRSATPRRARPVRGPSAPPRPRPSSRRRGSAPSARRSDGPSFPAARARSSRASARRRGRTTPRPLASTLHQQCERGPVRGVAEPRQCALPLVGFVRQPRLAVGVTFTGPLEDLLESTGPNAPQRGNHLQADSAPSPAARYPRAASEGCSPPRSRRGRPGRAELASRRRHGSRVELMAVTSAAVAPGTTPTQRGPRRPPREREQPRVADRDARPRGRPLVLAADRRVRRRHLAVPAAGRASAGSTQRAPVCRGSASPIQCRPPAGLVAVREQELAECGVVRGRPGCRLARSHALGRCAHAAAMSRRGGGTEGRAPAREAQELRCDATSDLRSAPSGHGVRGGFSDLGRAGVTRK